MAVTWNPSDKSSGVTLSGGNLTMTSTAAASGVRGTVGFNSGKRVYGFNCTGANYLHLGVANASGLLTSPSGRFDSNGAVYRDGGGSNSFRANNNAVNVSGFGGMDGRTGFVAVDITGGKFYIYLSGIGWGPGNPDAGTGGYDMSSIAGQTLYPYANGDDAFSPYPATVVIIDGAATGHGLSTFTPWDGGASSQTLTPSLFTNTSTFYSPTINRGSVSLLPSLFTNSSAFYAATISQSGGAQTLTPARFDNTSTFYGPALALGAVTLTPSLFTNASTFYGATVARGTVTLSPGLFTNTSTFYGATVVPGVVTITPGLFTNASTFYAPTINQASGAQTLNPSLFTNTSLFYGATILQPSLQTLLPGLFTNASVFFLPTIANDMPGGTYPESIEGGGSVLRGSILGGGSVVAGSITSTGRVIAGYLRGRP